MTPFEMFSQDTNEVIMLINYYVEKGNNTEYAAPHSDKTQGEKRIRVNDKTATGGWY